MANIRVVVKNNFDKNTTVIVRDICLSRWQPVANAFFRHEFLSRELIKALDTGGPTKSCVMHINKASY